MALSELDKNEVRELINETGVSVGITDQEYNRIIESVARYRQKTSVGDLIGWATLAVLIVSVSFFILAWTYTVYVDASLKIQRADGTAHCSWVDDGSGKAVYRCAVQESK